MKRAEALLVSILLAVSALGATAQGASAYTADAWSNSNAFSYSCLGFTDTYPQQLYSLATSQLAKLGVEFGEKIRRGSLTGVLLHTGHHTQSQMSGSDR